MQGVVPFMIFDICVCKSLTENVKGLPKYKVEVNPKLWGSINSLMKALEVDLLNTTKKCNNERVRVGGRQPADTNGCLVSVYH